MNFIMYKDEDFERVYKLNYQRYFFKIFFMGIKYYKKRRVSCLYVNRLDSIIKIKMNIFNDNVIYEK